MKKVQFLVIAVIAVLVVPVALPVCLYCGETLNGGSTVSSLAQAAAGSPLPNLSESVAPSSASAPQDQTDNTTTAVSSSGAVKASFTVVSQPADNREESLAAQVQAIPNNQAYAAAHARPESGGLPLRRVLFTVVLSAAAAAVGAVALRHVYARKDALSPHETRDSS